MNTAARLSAYVAALAFALGGAWAVGTAVGPVAPSAANHDGTHARGDGGVPDPEASRDLDPTGLASTRNGYTFAAVDTVLTRDVTEEFAFRITGPDGAPVTQFDVEQDKLMHLIVVRRDTTGYQHVHPQIDPDGTWRVPLRLPAAGTYWAFADFIPAGGEATTLGVDLIVPGEFVPVEHQPSRTAQVPGGYQVHVDGDLTPGRSSKLTLIVTKDGKPVTDLQPYLGAYGHLVVLRRADLAYLHVHPEGALGDGQTAAGPQIVFFTEVPSAGDYRLFLDFQHQDAVRTAEFTPPARVSSLSWIRPTARATTATAKPESHTRRSHP